MSMLAGWLSAYNHVAGALQDYVSVGVHYTMSLLLSNPAADILV